MEQAASWYSVVIDHEVDGGWRRYAEPWTQAYDCDAAEVAERVANGHDLAELDHPWTVGVFAGYFRFDELVAELKS